jgi:hypothetical protein
MKFLGRWAIGRVGLLLGALSPSSLSAQVVRPDPGVTLAVVGQHLSGNAWRADRRPWFALVRSSSGHEISAVNVLVTATQSPCTGPERTLALASPPAGEARLLVTGLELRSGPVETAWNEPRFLYPGESISLRLGEQWFSLSAFGRAVRGAHDMYFEDYRLVLRRESGSQTLVAFKRFGLEGHPEVRWTGDLDRDGFIDVLMDVTTSYAGSVLVLFMSAGAPPGRLVAEVARLELPGC